MLNEIIWVGPSSNIIGVLKRRMKSYRNLCAQTKGHMRTQQEGIHLQAERRGLRRNQICQNLDLGLPAFSTEK